MVNCNITTAALHVRLKHYLIVCAYVPHSAKGISVTLILVLWCINCLHILFLFIVDWKKADGVVSLM